MHRHMRRVGDELAVAVEKRAGEIEPLLDVDRMGGVLQRHAHLLGDRHEQIVEHLQHHRIGFRSDRIAFRARRGACERQVIVSGHFGAPAGFQDDGLVVLDNKCRPEDLMSRLKLPAQKDAGVAPLPV